MLLLSVKGVGMHLLKFTNWVSFFVLGFAFVYFYYAYQFSSSQIMAEESSKSIYDFTVKVLALLHFCFLLLIAFWYITLGCWEKKDLIFCSNKFYWFQSNTEMMWIHLAGPLIHSGVKLGWLSGKMLGFYSDLIFSF